MYANTSQPAADNATYITSTWQHSILDTAAEVEDICGGKKSGIAASDIRSVSLADWELVPDKESELIKV